MADGAAGTATGSAVHRQRELEELQEQSRAVFLTRDVQRLKALWSDALVVNSPLGRVLDREDVLDLLQRGAIAHASYSEHIEAMTRFGELVIVMGHDVVQDTREGASVRRRFTNVWQRRGESWRMIARHASPIAQP